MNMWWQLLAAAFLGSVSLGWLIFYMMRKRQVSDVHELLNGEQKSTEKKILKTEAMLLSSLKLEEKHYVLLRITAIAIAVALVLILGYAIGLSIAGIALILLMMRTDKLEEMKREIDSLTHAIYIINSTYGRGLALSDTFRELREANNDDVQRWTSDYLEGNMIDVPHRLVSLLQKMQMFEDSGKNAEDYIFSVQEQVQNKAEMINAAIISIREVLPIKLSFYGAVPFFMILSYAQAPDIWNSWLGGVFGGAIIGMFLGYNILLKKITNSVYQLVDF